MNNSHLLPEKKKKKKALSFFVLNEQLTPLQYLLKLKGDRHSITLTGAFPPAKSMPSKGFFVWFLLAVKMKVQSYVFIPLDSFNAKFYALFLTF